MCMRKCMLNFGEKVFNVLVVLGLIAGVASSVEAGIIVGGKQGIIAGIVQLVMFWGCTLVVSLIVYALLDIRHSLCGDKDQDCHKHVHTEGASCTK